MATLSTPAEGTVPAPDQGTTTTRAGPGQVRRPTRRMLTTFGWQELPDDTTTHQRRP